MSDESNAFKAAVANLKGQKDQVVAYVAKIQGDLVAANEATAAAIAAGATDKEIADAAREAQPDIVQVVNDLDLITPDGTPVVVTP